VCLLAVGCAQSPKTANAPTTRPTTRPAERPATTGPGIAGRIEAAHGLAAWQSARAVEADLAVTFGGAPVLSGSMLYDHHTNKVRIDVADKAMLFFDGKRAWVSPASADVPRARFHLQTWPYFLAAPFKLQDPGTHLEPTGPRLLNGTPHETARLTFDPTVGDSPDDWYFIYEDPATGRLAAMGYIVTYGGVVTEEAEAEPHAIVYHDDVTIDGATLSRRWLFHHWSEEAGPYGDPIGEVRLSNLRFVEPDGRAFAVPAGVKEDRLPAKAVARYLEAFRAGRLPAEEIEITYTDLHGLWGGLRLTVAGTGRVEQESVRADEQPPQPRQLTDREVREIADLLLEVSAWEQRAPDRAPQPDESRARLIIRAGPAQSVIWEWYNDLDRNARIARVRDLIESLAWSPAAP
jgi:hypothetical protein